MARVAARLQRRWRKLTKHLTLCYGPWRFSRAPADGDPSQGWKIHLSATILSADRVFALASPILRDSRVLFKVPAELSFLTHLNSGGAGFSQIGKFITVYSISAQQAAVLLKKLHLAIRGLPGPDIPFDLRYRRNSSVFYRYGSYATQPDGTSAPGTLHPDGKPHPDKRAPRCAIQRGSRIHL